MPLVLITTCSMYRNHFLVSSLDGWRIGQCNRYRSSPCVFRTLDQFSPWSGTTIFWSCPTDFRSHMSPRVGNFEFFCNILARSSRIPKRFGPEYSLVLMLIRVRVLCHGQCLPIFKPLFAVVDEIRLSRNFIRFVPSNFQDPICTGWRDSTWLQETSSIFFGWRDSNLRILRIRFWAGQQPLCMCRAYCDFFEFLSTWITNTEMGRRSGGGTAGLVLK